MNDENGDCDASVRPRTSHGPAGVRPNEIWARVRHARDRESAMTESVDPPLFLSPLLRFPFVAAAAAAAAAAAVVFCLRSLFSDRRSPFLRPVRSSARALACFRLPSFLPSSAFTVASVTMPTKATTSPNCATPARARPHLLGGWALGPPGVLLVHGQWGIGKVVLAGQRGAPINYLPLQTLSLRTNHNSNHNSHPGWTWILALHVLAR